MDAETNPKNTHPTGELTPSPKFIQMPPDPPKTGWPIDTPGGRYFAELDGEAPVSVHGQLAFFAQFLTAGQRWDTFLSGCPLSYEGNRGSGARNVFGTAALSILCGHWRYLHINAVRGDVVNAGLLGIHKIVSDDVVRNALNHKIDEAKALAWLHNYQQLCLEPMLTMPWILDVDTTVKPIYGNQEGAEISYNPHKPGRPSHVYHSYFMGGTRLCLGVDVQPGKKHAAGEGLPGLWAKLEALPRSNWPTFLRGDCGYGQEPLLLECEEKGLPYLFKLKFTPNVKKLVKAVLHDGAWHRDGSGWEVCESTLKLSGWTKARRVIIVRESNSRAPIDENPQRSNPAKPNKRKGKNRELFDPKDAQQWSSAAPWSGKLAVIVTSLDPQSYPTTAMGQLYRDRGDMENNYDEYKNQWGWNGYTTKKLAPCRIMANLIALVANWWNLYARLFDEDHHREAITTRPALLSGVARQVSHGGQKMIKVSILHEKAEVIEQAITLISKFLSGLRSIARGWSPQQSWAVILTRIWRKKLGGKWLGDPPPGALPLLSG